MKLIYLPRILCMKSDGGGGGGLTVCGTDLIFVIVKRKKMSL